MAAGTMTGAVFDLGTRLVKAARTPLAVTAAALVRDDVGDWELNLVCGAKQSEQYERLSDEFMYSAYPVVDAWAREVDEISHVNIALLSPLESRGKNLISTVKKFAIKNGQWTNIDGRTFLLDPASLTPTT